MKGASVAAVPTCADPNVGNSPRVGRSQSYLPNWEISRLRASTSDPKANPQAICDMASGEMMPDYWNATFQSDWLAFVADVAKHYDKKASGFVSADALHATDYRPSRIDYVRVAVGLNDEGSPFTSGSALAVKYAGWGYTPASWAAWQKGMLIQYRNDFAYAPYPSPAVMYPVNVPTEGTTVPGGAVVDCNTNACAGYDGYCKTNPGVTCSQVTINGTGMKLPTSLRPKYYGPEGDDTYGGPPLNATLVGDAASTDFSKGNFAGTTAVKVVSVSTSGDQQVVVVTPEVSTAADFREFNWQAVQDSASGSEVNWTSSAYTVARWAVDHGFSLGQNGVTAGWAENYSAHSYLQGDYTHTKGAKYYPELPGDLTAQTMLEARAYGNSQLEFPAVYEFQTAHSMTYDCPTGPTSCVLVRTETPPHGGPHDFDECAAVNVQWVAYLAASNWTYQPGRPNDIEPIPEDSGAGHYYATTLEVFHSDLDDTQDSTSSANNYQGVQTTYYHWAIDDRGPFFPPVETYLNYGGADGACPKDML